MWLLLSKTRLPEKAAFDTAKADLELGISGVQKALGVLRDYYQGSERALHHILSLLQLEGLALGLHVGT